jgi:hypothetical protein
MNNIQKIYKVHGRTFNPEDGRVCNEAGCVHRGV